MPSPDIPKLLEWREMRRNSLCGFAKVEFPSGLVINDIVVLTGERGPWAAPPSKPMVSRDGAVMKDEAGKIRYVPLIEFATKGARARFSEDVIAAVRAARPEALA